MTPYTEALDLNRILAGDIRQLQCLLYSCGYSDEDAAQDGLDPDNLIRILNTVQQNLPNDKMDILALLETQEPGVAVQLSPGQRGTLMFADRLYAEAMCGLAIDIVFQPILLHLRLPFVKLALLDQSVLIDPEHGFRKMLDRLCIVGVTWLDGLGKAGEKFYAQLLDLVTSVGDMVDMDPAVFGELQNAIVDHIDADTNRVKKIEARLAEVEIGSIKAQLALSELLLFLNQKVAGRRLPDRFIDFLQGTWRFEMQVHLIQEGMRSSLWQRWKKIIETIVWAFSAGDSEEERKKLYKIVPALGKELEQNIALISKNPSAHDELLSVMDGAFVEILKGTTTNCITAPPLAMPEMLEGIETHVSKALLKKVEDISEGSWIVYKDENDNLLRCKLLLKIPDTDQLLFVNRMGQKVMQKGIEDFAYCLSAKIARPLCIEGLFNQLVVDGLSRELEEYENMKMLRDIRIAREDEAQRLDKELREFEAAEAARESARLERAKLEAARKAEAEAEALDKAREQVRLMRQEWFKKEEERLMLERQEEDENRRRDAIKVARLTIDTLSIGSWVSVPDKEGAPVKCKLAVKLNSSGKHVFVDRVGIKVNELYRDDLIALLLDGEMTILEQGVLFEERLAKVVDSLRRDKN